MNMDSVNKWLMLAANLGVIAGIIFLVIEIQQNNELMAANASFNRLSIQIGSNTLIASNSELAGIITKANNDEELSSAESLRLFNYNMRALSNLQWTFREVVEEELPLEFWRSVYDDNLHRRRFWEAHKMKFSQDFVNYYDQLIKQ